MLVVCMQVWTPWHERVCTCAPECMPVCAHMCTRLQPPFRTPWCLPRGGSSLLSGYGSARSPRASPPAPCKHLARPCPGPHAQAAQTDRAFLRTRLTLALRCLLPVDPPEAPSARLPLGMEHTLSLPPAMGQPEAHQPHWPGQACSGHVPGARPPPSQDSLDLGNRAR